MTEMAKREARSALAVMVGAVVLAGAGIMVLAVPVLATDCPDGSQTCVVSTGPTMTMSAPPPGAIIIGSA